MADIVAEIKKIPPVTRFVVVSSLGVTLSAILGLVSPYNLVFISSDIIKRWQFWRAHTSMFLGGDELAMKLEYIFEVVMLYRNSNSLESVHYKRRSSDYAWQLFLACTGIIALNRPIGSFLHNRALMQTITYTMCALSPPGAQTSIMSLVTIPIKYFPYALLFMDLFSGRAAESVSGMIVGHLWWWLVWGGGTGAGSVEQGRYARFARAPGWLRNWFGEHGGEERVTHRTAYQAFAPRQRAEETAGARTTGYSWGAGQRLGS
ncbi:Der1-like family-domain-containing protein [Melanogaster broomeanus]|nr:Der1-like family-domain-containing protein [Melanogaster broomeanus]